MAPSALAPRTDPATLSALADAFARDGYVELQACVDPGRFAALGAATRRALDARGARRDLRMAATDGTPRRYVLAGRDALAAADPLFAATYRDAGLRAALDAIGGEALLDVPYRPEEFVAARYDRVGDTHGWHWDDYAYACIWVFAAPEDAADAALEYVRGVPWDKTAPQVAAHVARGPVERRRPRAGTVYLLRTDTALHRVTPLRAPALREILCFSYRSAADDRRAISHETIEALLGA